MFDLGTAVDAPLPLPVSLDLVGEALVALMDREGPANPLVKHLLRQPQLCRRVSKVRALRFLFQELEGDPLSRVTWAIAATMRRFGVSERTCWRWIRALPRKVVP